MINKEKLEAVTAYLEDLSCLLNEKNKIKTISETEYSFNKGRIKGIKETFSYIKIAAKKND